MVIILTICVNQTIMQYTLNLHSDVCQLFFNKTGGQGSGNAGSKSFRWFCESLMSHNFQFKHQSKNVIDRTVPHKDAHVLWVWLRTLRWEVTLHCPGPPRHQCVGALSLSRVWLFATLWAVAHQAVHGILWTRILEWVAVSSSKGSSQPRDRTHISCIDSQILYHWAM